MWDEPAAVLPSTYVGAVEEAGGLPIVAPPTDDGIDELLDAVDGVILGGGPDIDPALYGGERDHPTQDPRPARDRFETVLAERALERDMPLLGICRGMQILNVVRGGDLVQEVESSNGSAEHKKGPGVFSRHDVEIETDSVLGSVLGQRGIVASHHHQAPGRIGEGLRRVAWAHDGTTEAIEDPEARFALGVLWHPEQSEDRALFQGFVDKAVQYRKEHR